MEVWDGLTDSRITFDWNQTGPDFTGRKRDAEGQTIAYMIENTNLTTGLQDFLAQVGGVEIISPARVESISHGASTETVDLSAWPTVHLDSGRKLVARLLVGAD